MATGAFSSETCWTIKLVMCKIEGGGWGEINVIYYLQEAFYQSGKLIILIVPLEQPEKNRVSIP